MDGGDSFRYRTILEVAVIAAVIYFFLGTPGLSNSGTSDESSITTVPKARAKMENLVYPSKNLECERHEYTTHIFSTSPLIVYVDGFLSNEEADHLIALR